MLPILFAVLLVQDGTCERTRDPALHSHGLAQVLDSARAVSDLEAVWSDDFDYTIAYVRYDSLGAFRTVDVHSEDADEEERGRLASALEGWVDQTAPQTEAVLLVLGDDDGLAMKRVERFDRCGASIKNRERLSRRVAGKARGLDFVGRQRVQLWVWVTEEGRVGETRVATSSGTQLIDQAALDAIDGTRFEPSRIEGIAVGTWVRFPITFSKW